MNPKDIAAVLEQHRYDQHPDTPEDLLHKAAISDALAELPGANKEKYAIIAAAYRAEAEHRAKEYGGTVTCPHCESFDTAYDDDGTGYDYCCNVCNHCFYVDDDGESFVNPIFPPAPPTPLPSYGCEECGWQYPNVDKHGNLYCPHCKEGDDDPHVHEWGRKINDPGTPVCVDCGALYAEQV